MFSKEQNDWIYLALVEIVLNGLAESLPENLPKDISLILHGELMRQLRLPGGFRSLAVNLVLSGDANTPQWKKCETLARIIASPGHGSAFYLSIVDEIASTAREALERGEDHLVEASIASLNALHGVKVNVILLDNKALMSILRLNSRAFRGSVSGAKSKILLGILPVLFDLSGKFPKACEAQEILQDLFVKCLSNRNEEELEKLTEIFLFDENHPNLLRLHRRIVVREGRKDEFSVQMGPEEDTQFDSAGNLVRILKKSNHNLLTYGIFKKILKLFGEVVQEKQKKLKLELVEAEDAQQIIEETFKRKTILILALSELISFQEIHFLLRENPQDIVPFILEALRREADKEANEEIDTEAVVILMSIFREFVVSAQAESFRKELWALLNVIRKRTSGDLGQYIDLFSREINEESPSFAVKSKFQEVRLLCDEKMPHIRVYGMTEMIKLIENKDIETLANLHSTFHIALQYLTDEDSYSFLTCIRLLVLLTMHLDEGAVDTLIHEYENAEKEIDFRLKVGEAIVKITEGLGPVAVKFKEILINCFLRAARNPHEDFRTSALYNLGGICRILTYQVHHFFHEMITTIAGILQTDTYAPCRRAAILILTQLLQGIENLVDSQEFLLPTYRLLKHIRETEKDHQCRVHAENGLKVINEKVKKSLNPEEPLQKEIKIFGVKDEGKPKASIFEI
uniref:Putative transport and golgi organization protein 6 n=1 Tax=Lutzomyia longipalpis TaxID=7200 RepID=A0A1B0GIW3_LUTLO